MHSNLNETNDFGWPAISNLSTDPSVSSGQVSDPNITTLALIKNCSSDVTGLKDEDQKREKSDDDDQKKRSNSSIGKESIIHWNQSRSSSENFSLRVSSSRMIDPIDDKDNRNDHSDIKAPENDTKFIKTTSHHTFNDSTGGVLNLNLTELERNSTSFLDRVNHISVPTNLSKVMNLTPSINLKQSSDLMDQDVRNQSLELKFNQSDKPLTSFDHSGPIIENQTLSIGVGAERNDLKNSSQVEVQNQNSSLISAGIKMDNINTTNNLINSEEIVSAKNIYIIINLLI